MGARFLWILLGLQAICAAFFVFDSALDAMGLDGMAAFRGTQTFEYIVTAALVLGTLLTLREIRAIGERQARMEAQLQVAVGAFEQVLLRYFDEWSLTSAERDVARLALKGLSVAEIANIRSTAEGTVKAQSTAIYRKAGVTGRPQLLSLFIEDLMGEGLVPGEA